jgi:hypothetical protein
MPTPSFGPIAMSDVSTETGATQNMDNFFDLANIGGLGGLNYSNLGMGPSANLTAKQAIYDQYASGQNMALSYWYSYNQDEAIVWEFYIDNQTADYIIDVSLEIYDGSTFTGIQANSISPSGAWSDTIGTVAPSTLSGGQYRVAASISSSYVGGGRPPGSGSSGTVSPYDMDNVGPGTGRSSPANVPFFDPNNPLGNLILVDGTIGTGSVYIYSSKRTGFDIVFT